MSKHHDPHHHAPRGGRGGGGGSGPSSRTTSPAPSHAVGPMTLRAVQDHLKREGNDLVTRAAEDILNVDAACFVPLRSPTPPEPESGVSLRTADAAREVDPFMHPLSEMARKLSSSISQSSSASAGAGGGDKGGSGGGGAVKATEQLLVLIKVATHYLMCDHVIMTPTIVTSLVSTLAKTSNLGLVRSSSGTAGSGGGQQHAASSGQLKSNEQEIRAFSLFAIAALAQKHAEAMLPQWSVLFPEVDPTLSTTTSGSVERHTLLTPLLFDPFYRCKAAAASAISQLVVKTHSQLQLAIEPAKGKQQSFASLATQMGKVLLSLHKALAFSLTGGGATNSPPSKAGGGPQVVVASSSSSDAGGSTCLPGIPKGSVYGTLAFVVSSTPYDRCPASAGLALKILRASVTLDTMTMASRANKESGGGGGPSATNDVNSVTSFVSACLRSTAFGAFVNKTDAAAATAAGSSSSAGKATTTIMGSKECSAIIDALVAQLPGSLMAWKAMTHLSRQYPAQISSRFGAGSSASSSSGGKQSGAWASSGGGGGGSTAAGSGSMLAKYSSCLSLPAPTGVASLNRKPSGKELQRGQHQHGYHYLHRQNQDSAATGPLANECTTEMLRGLTHFLGYAWTSFDEDATTGGTAGSAASGSAGGGAAGCGDQDTLPRATAEQKQQCLDRVLLPALKHEAAEVRGLAYKACGQLKNTFMASLSPEKRSKIFTSVVEGGLKEASVGARCEAVTAVAVWAWVYPSIYTEHFEQMVEVSAEALFSDREPIVQAKACFALSNLTERLTGDPSHSKKAQPAVEASVESIRLLGDAAVFASKRNDVVVVAHSIRIMGLLLRFLSGDDLIMELTGCPEGAANYFLTVLGSTVATSRDTKHRWNAAHAIGEALTRIEVFYADPPVAQDCIRALLKSVQTDVIFKVRSRSAAALIKIHPQCFSGSDDRSEPTTPIGTDQPPSPPPVSQSSCLDALCKALETSVNTDSFNQYKEVEALKKQLTMSIAFFLNNSTGSPRFQSTMSRHKKLLDESKLL